MRRAVKQEPKSCSDSEDDKEIVSVFKKYEKWDSDESSSDAEDVSVPTASSGHFETRRRSRGAAQNRNAVMARENRIKKKIFLETLQKERDYYKKNYREAKASLKKYKKKIKALVADYTHLRNLVRNESQISRLLVGINSSLRNDRRQPPSLPFNDHPPTPSPDAGTLWRDADPMLPTPDSEVSSLLRESLADQSIDEAKAGVHVPCEHQDSRGLDASRTSPTALPLIMDARESFLRYRERKK